jgi:hypothetical protein
MNKNIGDGVISMMFRQIDKNGNGKLEFNEALRIFQLLQQAGHIGGGGGSGGGGGGGFY